MSYSMLNTKLLLDVQVRGKLVHEHNSLSIFDNYDDCVSYLINYYEMMIGLNKQFNLK